MGIRIILTDSDFSGSAVSRVNLINPNVVDQSVTHYISYVKNRDVGFDESLYEAPLNILAQKMKLLGLWQRLDFFYLFLGTSKESQAVSLINPGNDILFFPATNTEANETPATFTIEGYEHHKTQNGGNVDSHNMAFIKVLDAYKTHPFDMVLSISGKVKAGRTGVANCDFAIGNLNKNIGDFTNKFSFGNNEFCGLGGFNQKVTPNFSYGNGNKLNVVFSLAPDGHLKVYKNSLLGNNFPAKEFDWNRFSNDYMGLGFFTSSDVLVKSDGTLDKIIPYKNNYGSMNFVFDNVYYGRSLLSSEVKMLNSILDEFREGIGRVKLS